MLDKSEKMIDIDNVEPTEFIEDSEVPEGEEYSGESWKDVSVAYKKAYQNLKNATYFIQPKRVNDERVQDYNAAKKIFDEIAPKKDGLEHFILKKARESPNFDGGMFYNLLSIAEDRADASFVAMGDALASQKSFGNVFDEVQGENIENGCKAYKYAVEYLDKFGEDELPLLSGFDYGTDVRLFSRPKISDKRKEFNKYIQTLKKSLIHSSCMTEVCKRGYTEERALSCEDIEMPEWDNQVLHLTKKYGGLCSFKNSIGFHKYCEIYDFQN